MRKREITIIGAGLAGSLLAAYLGRRGMTVRLFERRPDLRKVQISAGRSINLALANRGINALREVGLMPQIEPRLIPMAGRMIHDDSGGLHFLPYGNKPHEVIYSVSRAELNSILMTGSEESGDVQIQFEHRCSGADLEKKTVTINDERLRFDVLLGADGAASEVRDAIVRATRGESVEEPLDHSYKELSVPSQAASGRNMDRHALHIWPRGEFMLIALPNPDGSFTATLFLPNTGSESFEALQDSRSLRDFFEKRFRDALPLLPNLEEEFFTNPTGRLGTVRCWPWHYRDRALVLGDAAHAIVPFHGQGMNAAFEDCSAFNAHLDLEDEWQGLFENFARERKPNADAIAGMAIENYVEMRSTVRDPKFQLKKELSFRLEERHPDRFIPRYSMVMFHSFPYAEAQRRGAVQEEILNALLDGVDRLDDVDLFAADELVRNRLTLLAFSF